MTEGVKHDQDKPKWYLLPWESVTEVVKVLTWGAKPPKYSPSNWKSVKGCRDRYLSAACRHISAWAMGERNDNESGYHHLAHAACCLLFLLWFELTGTPYPEEPAEEPAHVDTGRLPGHKRCQTCVFHVFEKTPGPCYNCKNHSGSGDNWVRGRSL